MNKLDLVNPLNPTQIIKTEDISEQVNNVANNQPNSNVVSDNYINETVSSNIVQNQFDNQNLNNIENINNKQSNLENGNSNKSKNKRNLILISVIIVLGLIIGCFLFFKLGNSDNPENPNNDNNILQPTTKISLNEIVKNFNKIVSTFPLENGTNVSAEVENDNIKVSIIYSNSVLHYTFPLNDRNLSSTIMKNDELAFKTTAYIISSISNYYGHDFNSTFNYINSNRNSLSNIDTITVTELDKLIIISLNIDNPVIPQ